MHLTLGKQSSAGISAARSFPRGTCLSDVKVLTYVFTPLMLLLNS